MPPFVWIALAIVLVLSIAITALVRWLSKVRAENRLEAARKLFHQQRERAEAKFFTLAAGSGKPRGLRWTNCDFSDDVTFARDRSNRGLSAFVGVNISFEAIEGGGMEDVEAVGNIRAATAVFHFEEGRWTTQGRAIMNLEPTEAVERFHLALERISDS